MKNYLAATCMLSALLLAGCRDEALRAELREGRFDFAHPKVEIEILDRVLEKPAGEYSGPTVRITGVVRQTAPFAAAQYHTQFMVTAMSESEGELRFATEALEMKDGMAAFTMTAALSRSTKFDATELRALKFELAEFGWWKARSWRSHVTLKSR